MCEEKVLTVVEIHHPCIFMRVRLTPSLCASTRRRLTPPMPEPPVRTATTNQSAFIPPLMNFFRPFTT